MTKQKFYNKVSHLRERSEELHKEIESFAKKMADENGGQIPHTLKAAYEASGWAFIALEKCQEISKPDPEKTANEMFDAPKVLTPEPSRIVKP